MSPSKWLCVIAFSHKGCSRHSACISIRRHVSLHLCSALSCSVSTHSTHCIASLCSLCRSLCSLRRSITSLSHVCHLFRVCIALCLGAPHPYNTVSVYRNNQVWRHSYCSVPLPHRVRVPPFVSKTLSALFQGLIAPCSVFLSN